LKVTIGRNYVGSIVESRDFCVSVDIITLIYCSQKKNLIDLLFVWISAKFGISNLKLLGFNLS